MFNTIRVAQACYNGTDLDGELITVPPHGSPS